MFRHFSPRSSAARLAFAAALPAFLLSGCASGSLRYAGAKSPASGLGNREATAVSFVCSTPKVVDAEAGGGIAAPLIGIAVDTALGAISASLAKAKAARTATWTAAQAIDFGKCETKMGTLTIIRGIFGADGKIIESHDTYPAFTLVSEVDLTEQEGKLAKITPTSLAYAETAAQSRGSKRKQVIVNIGINSAEAAQAEAKPGAVALDLGKLEIGKTYENFNLMGITKVPQAEHYAISVLVTESEDASVALEVLAAAFEANKSDLAKALEDTIGDAIGPKDKAE